MPNTVKPHGAQSLLAGDPPSIDVQAVAAFATIAFTESGSFALVSALRTVMTLRIPVNAKTAGVDIRERGEEANKRSDLPDLTMRGTSPSDPVVLPSSEMYGALASAHG